MTQNDYHEKYADACKNGRGYIFLSAADTAPDGKAAYPLISNYKKRARCIIVSDTYEYLQNFAIKEGENGIEGHPLIGVLPTDFKQCLIHFCGILNDRVYYAKYLPDTDEAVELFVPSLIQLYCDKTGQNTDVDMGIVPLEMESVCRK